MKRPTLALLAALALPIAGFAAELEQLAYPTADEPSFILAVPSDWKLTPAEEVGEYFHLEGPNGAVFSFRTLEGDKASLDEAIEASLEDIHKRFDDVEIGKPEDWTPDGLQGFYVIGQGKEKDGTVIRIGLAWCALNDGKIAEAWFVADLDDEEGMNQANDIANSLKSP